MDFSEKHGKRHQVSYRISQLAEERLHQHAKLFNLKPSEYAKAVLYKDLGIFDEPLDHRRRRALQQKKRQEEEDDSFSEAISEDEDPKEFSSGRGSTVE